jgi:hypothetical protein
LEVARQLAISEDDLVRLARQAHSRWVEMMESRGYHPSSFCPCFGKGCSKCNPDMVPFDDLQPDVREGYLSRIRSFEESLGELGYLIHPPRPSQPGKRPWTTVGGIELATASDGADMPELKRAVSTYRRP